MSEHDQSVIVSRADLRALVDGETTVGELYDRSPKWGRRAALAALGTTGAAAFLVGQSRAQTDPSGTVGPYERGVVDRMQFIEHTSDPAGVESGDLWYNSGA